jgi:hypothetical protein
MKRKAKSRLQTDVADQSVAGEEDPGAALDTVIAPTAAAPGDAGNDPAATPATRTPASPGCDAVPEATGTRASVCGRCGGSGRIDGALCPTCGGIGTVVLSLGS